MNRIKNPELLAELVQSAVRKYIYETDDYDFTADITVAVEDGWAKTSITQDSVRKYVPTEKKIIIESLPMNYEVLPEDLDKVFAMVGEKQSPPCELRVKGPGFWSTKICTVEISTAYDNHEYFKARIESINEWHRR